MHALIRFLLSDSPTAIWLWGRESCKITENVFKKMGIYIYASRSTSKGENTFLFDLNKLHPLNLIEINIRWRKKEISRNGRFLIARRELSGMFTDLLRVKSTPQRLTSRRCTSSASSLARSRPWSAQRRRSLVSFTGSWPLFRYCRNQSEQIIAMSIVSINKEALFCRN